MLQHRCQDPGFVVVRQVAIVEEGLAAGRLNQGHVALTNINEMDKR